MASYRIAITTVCPVGRYWLRLSFTDGSIRDVDLTGSLRGPLFGPLRNYATFDQVRIDEFGIIRWPTGASLEADVLYEMGIPYREAGIWAA
jgi:hypothetical protein